MIEPLLAALEQHAAVRSVRLAGSRGRREAPTALSDWDLEVVAEDFEEVAADLPELAGIMEPLVGQWDPYGPETCYMLMLDGAVKIDVIFPSVANRIAPPWEARPDTLVAIDHHFWDWILWLGSKLLRGQDERVGEHLRLMWINLLQPMGATQTPGSVEDAVGAYLAAREELERRFEVAVPRELEASVIDALRRAGFGV